MSACTNCPEDMKEICIEHYGGLGSPNCATEKEETPDIPQKPLCASGPDAKIKPMCSKCKWYKVKGGAANCNFADISKCFVSA